MFGKKKVGILFEEVRGKWDVLNYIGIKLNVYLSLIN